MKRLLLLVLGLVQFFALPVRAGDEVQNAQEAQQAVIKGNTQFALDLYAKLAAANTPPAGGAQERAGPGNNFFFSPYSISSALAMTYAGAAGQTAKEMAGTLHFDLDNARLHPAFGALGSLFNATGQAGAGGGGAAVAANNPPAFQLTVANALWGQQNFPFLPAYQNLVKTNYAGQVASLDFAAGAEPSRLRINDWVAKATQDKIQNLIGPGSITPKTRLVLTNAIYFKSQWADQFQKNGTQFEPFNLSPDKQIQTATMHMTHELGFYENDDLQMVRLGYRQFLLEMTIIMPRKIDGLPALEKTLDAPLLDKLNLWITTRPLDLSMPRFKLISSVSLSSALKSLGMKQAFSDQADFSGMTGTRDLNISDVIHKAYVNVDEEGTEAAAATAVMGGGQGGIARPPDPPRIVTIDRPFIFLIRHYATRSILFMGA